MEITTEKSKEQAAIMQMINAYIPMIDVEYIEEAATQTQRQADSYDTMAVLNRMWTPTGADLLRKQASALRNLAAYIKDNMAIDDLRKSQNQQLDIMKQFFVTP